MQMNRIAMPLLVIMGMSEIDWQRQSPCYLIGDPGILGMPVWIKRDDLLHPQISGNKFRKLKYPLQALKHDAVRHGQRPCLVTMGGIWSNHLHATAYAAALSGYASVGLVRGVEGMTSATLEDCRAQGMQIHFVDRMTYRTLRDDPAVWPGLAGLAPDTEAVWLPEGGSAPSALHGVAELSDELPFIPDSIVVACGTAATMAGLLAGLKGRGRVTGIAVLNNAEYLHGEVARLLCQAGYPAYTNYQLHTNYHHGGYAKVTPSLRQFCDAFTVQSGVPVEPVYTGKALYALRELVHAGYFGVNERVLMLHTGGLQGGRGSLVTLS